MLSNRVRAVSLSLLLALAPVGAALADPPAPATPPADASAWQSVITQQIDDFRKGDAAGAFSLAAAAFHKTFADANAFMVAIAASGYTPILTSDSESFGQFEQVDPNTVMQMVFIDGPNGAHFDAVYQVGREGGAWRVMGVELAVDTGAHT